MQVLTLYRAALRVARAFPVRMIRAKTCYNARELMLLYRAPRFLPLAPKLIEQGVYFALLPWRHVTLLLVLHPRHTVLADSARRNARTAAVTGWHDVQLLSDMAKLDDETLRLIMRKGPQGEGSAPEQPSR
jgi:hypothetical protein